MPPSTPTPDPDPASTQPTLEGPVSGASDPTVLTNFGERPGTRIGPYKLLQLIGEGGFGSVFMAQQEHPVKRTVALKIIKLGMDTRQVVARFEQERQALAMMDHPNIARVLDAGATETGRPFFVMDLVKGDPIVEYCDKNNLSIVGRLELFSQVCNAVQHAHTKGIIHRDIKPSNILVSMQDGVPSPKVIDFGIAKATSARLTDKTLFTEHRGLIGTPEYMSPEQAEGSLDIDTRTDVYSLGVLLYELLTGVTPFDSASLRAAAYAEVQRIIREVEPPIPSTRLSRSSDTLSAVAAKRQTDPRKLNLLIRGDLDWIVMKALEKDRQRRYETANGLALDIRRHLSGEAVIAAPPGAGYRVRKFIKRNRVMVFAGAAVAAALLVGVAAFAWQAKEARDQRDNAVKAQQSEARQRKTADEKTEAARLAADTAERAAYQAQIISAASAVESQRIEAAGALLAATPERLRGWEHRHLTSRLDRTLPSPFPADWRITWFTSSAGSARHALRRSVGGGPSEWVVLDGNLRTPLLVVPDTQRFSFELSPDGSRAVWAPPTTEPGRPAVLWDIDSRSVLATFPVENDLGPESTPVVTWSAAGDRFAIGHVNGYQVHNARAGARLHSATVGGYMYFTGDPRWMVLHGERSRAGYNPGGFRANEFRLFDTATFEPVGEAFSFGSSASHASFRGSRLVVAVDDGTLRFLEIEGGVLRERNRVVAGLSNFNRIAHSTDGRLIALGSGAGGRMRVWDADSGELRADFGGPQSGVITQWFLPDSGDLCACDADGRHRVWPLRAGPEGVLTAHKSYVYPAAVSTDGGLLVTGGWDGFVGLGGGLKFWDARTAAPVAEHGEPGEMFFSAALTPDARFLVANVKVIHDADCRIDILDLKTGTTRSVRHPARAQPAICTALHPDGQRAISTYSSGEAYLWELATGNLLWQTDLHPKSTSVLEVAAAFSPDGRLLTLGDRKLGIRVVDTRTYADIRRWEAHTDGIWSLSFSPDSKWLLSASEDQTVGVWDVATGALVARLTGHGAKVLCAAMSPDGTRIASGGRDGIVRLWDTTHFENIAQLGGHTDYIFCVAWSPDGERLYSTSGDSTVRVWDTLTLAEQLAAARERSEALPPLEARIARARADARDAPAAVLDAIASPHLKPRERVLAQQVATRFGLRGAPAFYRAPRAAAPIAVDGKIDEAAWEAAPWSEPFVDIEGDARPKPRFETRLRMLWDDTNLYIAAKMEEPHVWGTLTNHDDIVFRDNDFEVFIDPEGDGRWYGEFEVNALGTIFDLRLPRPYSERGMAQHEWSPPGVRAAVAIDGTLNDPSDTDRGWTVEIAIPHAAFADHANTPLPPRAGDVWRINFSRVQWLHDVVEGRYVKRPNTKEDNWVWTPQHMVDMHRPREWGFVEFAGDPSEGKK